MAVIVLRVREPGLERPRRMPLYPLPALFALVINTALCVAFVAEDPSTSLQVFLALGVLTVLVTRGTRAANREQV